MKIRRLLGMTLALVTAIGITTSVNVKANSSDGWTGWITPQYTLPSGTRNQWGDNSASGNIMYRLQQCYSYKNRMPTIQGRGYMQQALYPQTANPYSDYSNITYCNSPYGSGYTEWYDSVYGMFLDYETECAQNKQGSYGDPSPPVSITQDSIDFANAQWGNSTNAYVATDQYDGTLGDAKAAAITERETGNYYPIYLTDGNSIADGIWRDAQNRGVSNLIVLGGSGIFPPNAGITKGMSIIRAGGMNRQETMGYIENLPNQMFNPDANHWTGGSNGIVSIGINDSYVTSKLQQQANDTSDVQPLSDAIAYVVSGYNFKNNAVGNSSEKSDNQLAVIGVHNAYMETYCIFYYNTASQCYLYQYILPNYFKRSSYIEFLDSNHNPVSSVSMLQGQTWNGYVRAHNTGNMTWDESHQFRLGTDGTSFPGQPGRYCISGSVSPNNYYDFPIALTGTSVGGFNLHYQMLQEGVQWFGNSLNIPVTVNPWANPNTQYGGVWLDTGSGPGASVYTSMDGSKWVKPGQPFYVSAVGYSPWSSEQINEAHLQIYNKSNTSDQQIIKSSGITYTPWGYNYWQDSAPNNSVHFLSGYGFARRNGSWNVDGNGQYVESYFKMSLTNNNTDYWQGSRMLCYPYGYFYWSNGSNFDYYNTIKTDGDPPISDNLIATMQGVNNVQITLKNCRDLRVGLNDSTVRVAVWHDGESYRDWYTMTRVSGTNDFSVTVDLTKNDHVGKYSTFDVQAYAADYLGNDGLQYGTTFIRPNPIPLNGRLTMTQYDYYDNASTYWVKPSSTFGVYTDGYFPSNYSIYPDRTYVLFAKDGVMTNNSARQYADINGKNTYGSEFGTYFTFINDGDKATRFQANSNNYISHTHHLKANADGTAFKMYFTNSFFVGAVENYPQYQDSGLWLKVDGKAPTGDVSFNLTYDLQLSAVVNNVSDNGGSGVKSLYAVISQPGTLNSITKNLYSVNANTWQIDRFDAYSVFNSEQIKIDIYSTDNVGNTALLKSQLYDLLTVQASVTPTLSKQGQMLTFDIVTTGQPNLLEIDFPTEISALDTTNITNGKIMIPITEQNYLDTKYQYYLPLQTPLTLDQQNNRLKSSYQFTVKAYKRNGKSATAQPLNVDVQGNIFNGLRTRMR